MGVFARACARALSGLGMLVSQAPNSRNKTSDEAGSMVARCKPKTLDKPDLAGEREALDANENKRNNTNSDPKVLQS